MLTLHKAITSLLITVVLFTVFTIFAFLGLFDAIEIRFYNPAITTHIANENNRNAKVVENFFTAIQTRFSDVLETDAVRRSLMPEESQYDFFALSGTITLFKESFEGIQWVRFIDSGGTRLNFSTYSPDIISYSYQIPFYRNYNEPDLPYELIAVGNGGTPKYTFDSKYGRVLFSFPLYDSFDIYCGTALFSLSMDSILDTLFIEGRMVSGHEIMLIQTPPGMVFGVFDANERIMPSQISSVWEYEEGQKPARLSSPDTNAPFILISTKTSQNIFIGSLIKEELYLFPWSMKLILLASFSLTMYLTIFLLFNLKQEPVTIIQSRLKRLQVSLLEQFYELKGEEDWNRWTRELEYRRGEISALLKQGIQPVPSGLDEKINTLINKSWDEFLSVLGGRREPGFDEEKLRAALNSMLAALPKAGRDLLSGGEVSPKKVKTGLLGRASAIVKELEEADMVEEVEELEELEEVVETAAKEGPASQPQNTTPEPPSVDLAALASQIEFSPEPEAESTEDDSIEHDLEIVSPFASMLGGFEDTADDDISPIGEETLKALPDEESPIRTGNIQSTAAAVIEEKEGLPFVSADALNPDKEEELINRDFKELVDSVIKN